MSQDYTSEAARAAGPDLDLSAERTTVGAFTYASVDLPDDRWGWAIVTDYRGPQEYGEVITAFMDGYEPSQQVINALLAGLNAQKGEL